LDIIRAGRSAEAKGAAGSDAVTGSPKSIYTDRAVDVRVFSTQSPIP